MTSPAGTESAAVVAENELRHMSAERASDWLIALWLGAIAFYSFLFVYVRPDRMRPAYVVVAVLAVVGVFLSGWLTSAPRYLAVAWPFTWLLANRRSRAGRAAVLVGSTVVQVVFLWLHFTWSVSP